MGSELFWSVTIIFGFAALIICAGIKNNRDNVKQIIEEKVNLEQYNDKLIREKKALIERLDKLSRYESELRRVNRLSEMRYNDVVYYKELYNASSIQLNRYKSFSDAKAKEAEHYKKLYLELRNKKLDPSTIKIDSDVLEAIRFARIYSHPDKGICKSSDNFIKFNKLYNDNKK